ncbi:DUF4065 domain-containing protein [Azospirillum sp. RWY-5-1]|uniref:DUF4065 domain-containing protein n=1 Tax=Azospirillum oleiclasticum TaxID=2735135 RepID=A0ABX2T5Q2_9PROT|nr:type II toxin-antitoxin system antitoxin SocA domain-containing protein [Azospirillum oleiclasticum]NYZ12413.1 DUF4065 domain-containing protein [Azospirillum oleiclasticum]NYZ19573.1 DUF4065 domain-containing protein [Azospirillum oleiclasticum]
MSDTIRAATDRLIQLSLDAGRPLSPLPLQKLLYFVEGWHLALTGAPLFDEEIQAWKDGPVVPSVYRRMKGFKDADIPADVIDTRPDQTLSPHALSIIDQVFEAYGTLDAGTLVGLTHLPGSPWDQTRADAGVLRGASSKLPIDAERIRAWFREALDAGLEPETTELVDVSPEELRDWTPAAA